MRNRIWTVNGNETRIDAADEIASQFAMQAVLQAQGRIPCGNIPDIDSSRVREAKPYVDRKHV